MTMECREEKTELDERIGVFICHCGENIAKTVDIDEAVEYAKTLPYVVHAKEYMFMCSKQGTDLMKEAIEKYKLTGTVVASCSHEQHWKTFADAIEEEGLNPHRHTQVNIREFVSWVTDDPKKATEKAKRYLAGGVARSLLKEPVETERIPVTQKALVIGAGVGGLRAAMDLAELGIPVVVVEREPSIGGKMTMLNKTFPTDECPMCTVAPLLNGVMNHPDIEVLTNSEVTSKEGTFGNFEVEVTTTARYVDDRCTSCGNCSDVCPVEMGNEWDRGFGLRKAIYKPFPQALPGTYVVDKKHCIECGLCEIICPTGSVDLNMKKKTKRTFHVGTIVVAIGYEEYDPSEISNYHTDHPNIITQLDFERMVAPTTLNKGMILRPSDGKVPKSVVVVQCVGSRNEQVGNKYCTGVCCMFGTKNASFIKDHLPDSDVYMCYIDIRTPGLHYEEYYRRAQDLGVRFIRGRPAELNPDPATGNIRVIVEDTLASQPMEINANMVVLSSAMIPPAGLGKLGSKLGLLRSKEGFAREFHIKMGPVRSSKDGIFLAGAVHSPKDITQVVAHAGGAASAAAQPLVKGYIEKRLDTAVIDPLRCIDCLACIGSCGVGAIALGEDGRPTIIDAACLSCGACVPSCPTGALQLRNFRERQITAEVRAVLQAAKEEGVAQ